MAGYFVKMDIDLAESQEVILLSESTGMTIPETIGQLYLFWRWVERHAGTSRGVTLLSQNVTLARVTSCDINFIEALVSVGWLSQRGGTYSVPNWEKRFSHTAKQNDTSAERQRRYREKRRAENASTNGHSVTRDMCDSHVTASRQNVTEALLEVEVETELEVDIKKKVRARFTPPSLEEVRQFCQEHAPSVNPQSWIAYYEANGWKVGRNPMKDWKAAVRTWEHNGYGSKQPTTRGVAQL